MSIFNIFSNQLSAVIEWKKPKANVIWWKYPSKRDEIINASKLIVAPSQGCALVYEGSLVEIIEQEGIYNLKTDNHPFIATLVNLRQNFESEHKLKIYFSARLRFSTSVGVRQAPSNSLISIIKSLWN